MQAMLPFYRQNNIDRNITLRILRMQQLYLETAL